MTEVVTEKRAVSNLIEFIGERHKIYRMRMAGKSKPWTQDKILQQYRFCNVYRELDAVTKWIAENWRDPNTNDPDVWFAMFVARYVNEPETLELVGYPVPWSQRKWFAAVKQRKAIRSNVFNAAYIIPTGGTHKTGVKHQTLSELFGRMWTNRKNFRPQTRRYPSEGVLASYVKILTEVPGVGTFMAGQVIADLKYTVPYMNCDDWWTFAVSGPGSRRGLNRVCGRDTTTRWNEKEWFETLTDLRLVINRSISKSYNMSELHAQDLQNCLCEFDKWCRAYYGEGKPKQKFKGI